MQRWQTKPCCTYFINSVQLHVHFVLMTTAEPLESAHPQGNGRWIMIQNHPTDIHTFSYGTSYENLLKIIEISIW